MIINSMKTETKSVSKAYCRHARNRLVPTSLLPDSVPRNGDPMYDLCT